jgi:hypothetical protein
MGRLVEPPRIVLEIRKRDESYRAPTTATRLIATFPA